MILSPTRRVLSSLKKQQVSFLLMGGQACILYGAAEFTRDLDITIRIDEANLQNLQRALDELSAEPIYFPTLSQSALERGHACHFRCRVPEAEGFRLDVMAHQRGVDPWDSLWPRRCEIEVENLGLVPVMSLPDLVQAKKTQRDKDWPMVRRLVETDIHACRRPTSDRVRFWLRECRTPRMLCSIARRYRAIARREASARPLLLAALSADERAVEASLQAEETLERERDRAYWRPLRAELERMRLRRRKRSPRTRSG